MEFTLGPTQQAVAEAAAHVLDGYQPGRETGRDGCYDRALRKDLVQSCCSWHLIADGAIELGGALPVNPNGGRLGEAYIHGMNRIAEAVRQVRGTSVNRVPSDGPVLVTVGTASPPAA